MLHTTANDSAFGTRLGSTNAAIDGIERGDETDDATITVQEGDAGDAPELTPGNPATDINDDGLFDDLNGNNEIDRGDAQALFDSLNDEAVTSRVSQFDRNDNNEVDRGDVQALFSQVE
jgi:hypothetical protein